MPDHPETEHKSRSLFERLAAILSPEPENRNELLTILHDAHTRKLIDSESLSMIEGVFKVNELAARDLMVPRSQIYAVDISRPISDWIPELIENGHSRVPVYEDEIDNVVGVILTKDLLTYFIEKEFNIRHIIRPAVFIPESKPANVLLRDFRANHNHMAIVVDEFGSIAGLITIEDVIEEIVGDIEDEYDEEDEEDEIRPLKTGDNPIWRVSALMELSDFNETVGSHLDEESAETIGGYLAQTLGRIPHTGDIVDIDDLHFVVLKADTSQVHYLFVEKRASS